MRDITESRDLAVLAAVIADEKKGRDVRVIDFEGKSALYDYVVIVSALSTRETKAIAREIDFVLKNFSTGRRIIQGMESGCWVLLDYGWIVVHVFAESDRAVLSKGLRPRNVSTSSNYRAFYNLEELWSDLPSVDLEGDPLAEELRREYLEFVRKDGSAESYSVSDTGASSVGDDEFEDGALFDEDDSDPQ